MRTVLAVAVAALVLGPGCARYTLLTPAELEQRGTREFPDVQVSTAVEASVAALKTLGFEVTQASPESGVVKTAPKVVLSSQATQTDLERSALTQREEGARSETTVTTDALAWSLSIAQTPGGVRIQAVPRAFRNGDEISENGFTAELMDTKFGALWKEVASALPATATSTPP